jgi:hypothetical protein
MQETVEHVKRHRDICRRDRFGRVVANAALAADEEHGGGCDGGEDGGVVACTAR